mgnify:CR=1 FL=1
MKHEVVITGIFYGTSKTGNPYRLLYLEDKESALTERFEGRRTYNTFAPSKGDLAVGDVIDIIVHKGEAIVLA